MNEIIIDFDKMSDTKEVYGQRPNIFYSGFIYALVGILLSGVIYSCFGKIETVAHANGIVRPNEDVSSVSSIVGGRVKYIYYTDGQSVLKGDVLYVLDTAETEIALEGMLETKEDYEFQIRMRNKFLCGVRDNMNPFSSDVNSPEYKYHVQFEQYRLSLKNTALQAEYDLSQINSNLDSANKQIDEINYQIDGLNQYKNSVQTGTNTVSAYPEYDSQYRVYENSAQSLQHDYDAKRQDVTLSTAEKENSYYLNYYREQRQDYDYLIRSVENGYSVFPAGNNSYAKSLFDDYISTYRSYQNSVDNASKVYDSKVESRSDTVSLESDLKADKEKLRGYEFYRDSVTNDTNYFNSTADGYNYRYLYDNYVAKYNALDAAVISAETAYKNASVTAISMTTEEETEEATYLTQTASLEQLVTDYNTAVTERDSYKATILSDISTTITQLQTSIAQAEASLIYGTSEIDVETARTQKVNADLTASSYKSKMLAQCKQAVDEIDQKINSFENTSNGTKTKNEQLSDLDTSYKDSREGQYYQAISQIDSSIDALEKEKMSVESNMKLNEIMRDMHTESKDSNGEHISVSMATINQLSTLLSEIEALETQLKDLNTQINQAEKQIEQATVLAERDGIVNAASEIVEGDVLSSGAVVATIIPGGESEYKVQMYVSNADIANLKVGDTVKYSLAALPRNQYGVVDGEITSISKDAIVQNGEYSGFFLVEGTIDNAELVDKDGNVGNITIGMQSDARIVTEKKRIIRYLLEKIDLF